MRDAGKVVSGLALVWVSIACGGTARPVDHAAPSRPSNVLAYDGHVMIVPDSSTLRARWTISGLQSAIVGDSISFTLNPGLYVTRLTGSGVVGYHTRDQGGALVVQVSRESGPQKGDRIEIEYAGSLILGDNTNAITGHWVELDLESHWAPLVEDLSHPVVSRLALELPTGWVVASGGVDRLDHGSHVIDNQMPLFDVSFSASPAFRTTASGGNRVYYVGDSTDMVASVLGAATACAGYLDSLFRAEPPLPPLTIVLAPRRGPGYGRDDYIVISPARTSTPAALQLYLCHEEAHYWVHGANPGGPENWLDEGIAQFIAVRAIRALSGSEAYARLVSVYGQRAPGLPPVWTDTSTTRPEAAVSYMKAPFILTQLELRIGSAAMDRVLVTFLIEPVRTTPTLLDTVRSISGDDAAAWLGSQLAH